MYGTIKIRRNIFSVFPYLSPNLTKKIKEMMTMF